MPSFPHPFQQHAPGVACEASSNAGPVACVARTLAQPRRHRVRRRELEMGQECDPSVRAGSRPIRAPRKVQRWRADRAARRAEKPHAKAGRSCRGRRADVGGTPLANPGVPGNTRAARSSKPTVPHSSGSASGNFFSGSGSVRKAGPAIGINIVPFKTPFADDAAQRDGARLRWLRGRLILFSHAGNRLHPRNGPYGPFRGTMMPRLHLQTMDWLGVPSTDVTSS